MAAQLGVRLSDAQLPISRARSALAKALAVGAQRGHCERVTAESSEPNVPARSFGWSDMFVDPDQDPRADGGFDNNERAMLSLAIVENQYSDVGTQVTLVWGEEGGGSSKPTVERHRQIEIRATVGPVPYGQQARETYATGWRTVTK